MALVQARSLIHDYTREVETTFSIAVLINLKDIHKIGMKIVGQFAFSLI